MQARTKRWLKLGIGWAFVAFGVVGLVLPILQGFLFLAIGFGILSQESAWVRRQLERLRRRYPETAGKFDNVHEQAAARIKRLTGRDTGRDTGSDSGSDPSKRQ